MDKTVGKEGSGDLYKKEPEDEEEEVIKGWIDRGHTKPVARDLALLEWLGLLEAVEGHTKGMSLYPFTVYLKNGGIICKAAELHQYVKEALRRRIRKGDKVKIYQSGFWYTTGTVTAVEDGTVTTRYKDVDKYGVTTWRTIRGPEKYVELVDGEEWRLR